MHTFWKKYYYDYLRSFVDFLTPVGSKKLIIDPEEAAKSGSVAFLDGKYEYIVASDVLGHIGDVQMFLRKMGESITDGGRIVITQYSALWEPILRLASRLRLRRAVVEQNWLSMQDLKNFAYLAGMETVKSGTKMLMPVYIPLVSFLVNKYLANIWPFTHLGLFHYLVIRKPEPRLIAGKNLPSISVIVPARNEAGTIEKIARELPVLGAFTEIIFVEGN